MTASLNLTLRRNYDLQICQLPLGRRRGVQLDPADRLVYRSNLLGSDQRITNTGGGNTSSKLIEKDPLTGEQVEVLWVKGSGGDLRTASARIFSSLYQDKLHRAAEDLRARARTRG